MDARLSRGRAAGAAAGLVALCASLAGAQPSPADLAPPASPAPPSLGPMVAPPHKEAEAVRAAPPPIVEAEPTVEIPVGPPRPDRSPVAIIGVLDKVTAETIRFAAPVGRRVRYKGLVFETRACQTWDPQAPHPRPSAYLVIHSDAALEEGAGIGERALFEGWMFGQAPAVHPFQHPVYDAWLESCAASAPA